MFPLCVITKLIWKNVVLRCFDYLIGIFIQGKRFVVPKFNTFGPEVRLSPLLKF